MTEQDNTNIDIDELLNNFIDGRLNERQYTEVKRMAGHDPEMAEKLQQLQKVRNLLTSLPAERAPAELLDNIKTSLEREILLDTGHDRVHEQAGVRELLRRRILAAAAMIALIAVLGALIYNILMPVESTRLPSTIADSQQRRPLETRQPDIAALPIMPRITDFLHAHAPPVFALQIETTQPIAVNASVARAIYDNELLDWTIINRQAGKTTYQLTCSRENIGLLLADVTDIWDRLGRISMAVATPIITEQITVEDITTRQLLEVIEQTSFSNRASLAKNFAISNAITKSLPTAQSLAFPEAERHNAFVPKPVLTSGRKKPAKENSTKPQDNETVSLTITITGS